jgi:hypothetical protein
LAKYDIAMENLDMARQYQKDLLNELNRLLLMRDSKKTNVKDKLDAHENKHNLVQYIGAQNPGKSDLLTEAHFDNEVSTIQLFYLVLYPSQNILDEGTYC